MKVEEIDMTLGMLEGKDKDIPKNHKIWLMGNSSSEIVQKRCLIEGKQGYELLKNHAVVAQINVKYENEIQINEIEQTPFGVSLNGIIPKHLLIGNNLLWKYMEFYKFKDIIENRQLHYSRLDQFQDKLEGQSSFTCKKAIALTPNFSREQKLKNIQLFNTRMSNNRVSGFASCWHINSCINFELWQEYGNNNKDSICIKTSLGRLENQLKKTKLPFINEPVQYFTEPYFNQNAYWYPALFKRDSFKHESEFRSIFFVNGLDLKYGKIKINPEKLITKIYLHPDASKDLMNEIKSILKSKNNSIPIQIAKYR